MSETITITLPASLVKAAFLAQVAAHNGWTETLRVEADTSTTAEFVLADRDDAIALFKDKQATAAWVLPIERTDTGYAVEYKDYIDTPNPESAQDAGLRLLNAFFVEHFAKFTVEARQAEVDSLADQILSEAEDMVAGGTVA